jgi:hypothetical protein
MKVSTSMSTYLEHKAFCNPLRRQSSFIRDHDVAMFIEVGTGSSQRHCKRTIDDNDTMLASYTELCLRELHCDIEHKRV